MRKWDWSQAGVCTSMYRKMCDTLFLNSSLTKACSFQSFTFVWFMTFCGNAWETWSSSLVFHWCYSFIFFQFLPYYTWSTGNPAVQCFSSPPLFWGKDVDGDSNLGCECGNGNTPSWPMFINSVCREGFQSSRKEILQ